MQSPSHQGTHAYTTPIIVATFAFAIALGLRQHVNVWLITGLASAVSLLVARRHAPLGTIFQHPPPRELILGLLLGAAGAMVVHLLYPLVTNLYPGFRQEVIALYQQLRNPPGPLYALPVLGLVVFVEELIWRGMLVVWLLHKGFRPASVWLLSTLAYTAIQLTSGSWILIALALGLGAALALLSLWRKNATLALITHLSWDLWIFVLFPVESLP